MNPVSMNVNTQHLRRTAKPYADTVASKSGELNRQLTDLWQSGTKAFQETNLSEKLGTGLKPVLNAVKQKPHRFVFGLAGLAVVAYLFRKLFAKSGQ